MTRRITLVLAMGIICAEQGCARPTLPPYRCKQAVPALPLKHCSDETGHIAGSTPVVLGGTCCCTPTDALMAKLHADGLCTDLDSGGLRARYGAADIVTALDRGHARCNNCCDKGPHVVLGGRCLSPPTPGTDNYERVAVGDK